MGIVSKDQVEVVEAKDVEVAEPAHVEVVDEKDVEVVDEPKEEAVVDACPVCKGEGLVKVSGKDVLCSNCLGKGVEPK